jgi:uncharacterized glyoxalase superfamily protein PhnB
MVKPYHIVDLNYITLYLHDHREAIAFYSRVFGAPETADEASGTFGWRMGSTWLTLFPAAGGPVPGSNPRNGEFAVQVSAPAEVDALYEALVAAGARPCMAPRDTSMYEPMRFGCVDDPFGVRIDVYCRVGG